LPTKSVATVVLLVVPSAVTVSACGLMLATPDPPVSSALQVIVALALFQPAALGAGVTTPVAVGAVLSNVYEGCAAKVSAWLATHLPLALALANAVTVTAMRPLPELAVKMGRPEVKTNAPEPSRSTEFDPLVTRTQLVLLSALTVKVRAAPSLA
jgi:hypothetical protein